MRSTSISILKIVLHYLLGAMFLLGVVSPLVAQALSFQKINYTVEDGLPSNECHDILQDSIGYIWIATDRGLVRFDGYEFKTYGAPEGLTDLSCLDMAFDKDQNIWIHTVSDKFFIYQKLTDHIELYQHQTTVDEFTLNCQIYDFFISGNDSLVVAIGGIGFLNIANDTGVFNVKRAKKKEGNAVLFTTVIEEDMLISHDSRGVNFEEIICTEVVPVFEGVRWYCQQYIDFGNKRYKCEFEDSTNILSAIAFPEVYRIDGETTLIHVHGVNYLFTKDSLVKVQICKHTYLDLFRDQSNGIYVGIHDQKGLVYYKSISDLQENSGSAILQNTSISRILEDEDGNMWCTSLDNGLYYLKKESINMLALPQLESLCFTDLEVGKNALYLVENNNKLYTLKDKKIQYILKDKEIKSIHYSDNLDALMIASKSSMVLKNDGSVSKMKRLDSTNQKTALSAKGVFSFDEGELFFTQSSTFMLYNNFDSIQLFNSYLKDNTTRLRILSIEKINKNSFLMGTVDGLRVFNNEKFKEIENCPKALNFRINAIKKLENLYVFGTQGNGIVFWDLKDSLIVLQKKTGLISNNIESLFVDNQNRVYASTKSGLSKISFNNLNEIEVKNYTTFHGLPSSEVNDVDQLGDMIYIATKKGIVTLVDDLEPAKNHQPFYTKIQVNDSVYSSHTFPSELEYSQNNLVIDYKSMDFKMQGKIPYRYKMNEQDWTESSATSVNYPSLPSRNYTFSLQSKNRDDKWSESIQLDFVIHNPWWRKKWFYLICILGFVLGVYFFYKVRTNRLKEKIEIEREIRELERSALQAQMNPHFIFNCLNSIQKFIIENDKENAMDYLGKFALLIRQSLNASTQNKIPLDVEISMLKNYLDLEKLRFKQKFDFRINMTSEINPIEISIPPLLIQPFVENAIIHGMRDKKRDGWISIDFSKQDENSIKVNIQDNGAGLSNSKITGKHKSLGASITAKRLAFNNEIKDGSYTITPSYSSEGTSVDILIKI